MPELLDDDGECVCGKDGLINRRLYIMSVRNRRRGSFVEQEQCTGRGLCNLASLLFVCEGFLCL